MTAADPSPVNTASIPGAVGGVPVAPITAETAPKSAAEVSESPTAVPRSIGSTVRAYVSITKPRVVELLLVTTVPAMVLAERGLPALGLVLLTLLGGALAAGSAHAFNQVFERDIDRLMARTAHRPLATSTISVRGALIFGTTLLVTAVGLMYAFVNPLAAWLTLAANAFYVLVYTVLLKRRTAQNIVWGGAAGCMPTLIGWAAVTGELAWPPVVLFMIVFFWTPPHYWPLAMRFRDDYAAAGVPMLPAVASAHRVAVEILAYSVAMVAASLLLVPVADLGWIYLGTAVVAGAWFLFECVVLLRTAESPTARPMRLFHGSITYLTLVFLAVAVDVIVLG